MPLPVLHHDISLGNVLFTDQFNCNGFLHDLDYSEVVLMPGDKVDDDLEEQILRRLKDMTVSSISYCSNDFKLRCCLQGYLSIHGS